MSNKKELKMKFNKFENMATKITPDMAREIIGRTTLANRNINKAKVSRFATVMRDRRWAENGESIVLDKHGNLMDGQHRLLALIEAGVALRFLVVGGVAAGAMPTIDTGNSRTVANTLSMDGHAHYNVLAAALGWLHRYETRQMLVPSAQSGFTPPVAKALLNQHPGIAASAKFASTLTRGHRSVVSPSPLAFCHYVMSRRDDHLATQFCSSLVEGTDIRRGSPLYALRRLLVNTASSSKKTPTLEVIAGIFRAWSATREGKTLRSIRWRRYGDRAESFPPLEAGDPSPGPIRRKTNTPEARLAAADYVRAALRGGPRARAEVMAAGQSPPLDLSAAAIRQAMTSLGVVVVDGKGSKKHKQIIALPSREHGA